MGNDSFLPKDAILTVDIKVGKKRLDRMRIKSLGRTIPATGNHVFKCLEPDVGNVNISPSGSYGDLVLVVLERIQNRDRCRRKSRIL